MAFHSRDPATDLAVRALAALKGKSLTETIREAVENEYRESARAAMYRWPSGSGRYKNGSRPAPKVPDCRPIRHSTTSCRANSDVRGRFRNRRDACGGGRHEACYRLDLSTPNTSPHRRWPFTRLCSDWRVLKGCRSSTPKGRRFLPNRHRGRRAPTPLHTPPRSSRRSGRTRSRPSARCRWRNCDNTARRRSRQPRTDPGSAVRSHPRPARHW